MGLVNSHTTPCPLSVSLEMQTCTEPVFVLTSISSGWYHPRRLVSQWWSALFVSATFLALIQETAQDTLQKVEIYIILLLNFGEYLYYVPLYIWRILTCFNAKLDPSRYPKVGNGPVYGVLNVVLVVVVSMFQVWFLAKESQKYGLQNLYRVWLFVLKDIAKCGVVSLPERRPISRSSLDLYGGTSSYSLQDHDRQMG